MQVVTMTDVGELQLDMASRAIDMLNIKKEYIHIATRTDTDTEQFEQDEASKELEKRFIDKQERE